MKTLALLAVALIPAAVFADDPVPKVVSKSSLASFRNPDGTVNNGPFGGGSGMSWFFDGNLKNGAYIGPNNAAANGSYVLLDFTADSTMPSEGWYVTTIDISEVGLYPYSLYYSTDGSNWKDVANGIAISRIGTTALVVNDVAKYVKVVFDVVGGWNPSISEIQVYAVDPPASGQHRHLAANLADWQDVQGTATCTDYGIAQYQCPGCSKWFQEYSLVVLPIGHVYEGTLDEPGTAIRYGSGRWVCSRCRYAIECPADEAIDLISTRVGGNAIGGVAMQGVVRFTDLVVSSTGDTAYGVNPGNMIDDVWTMSWNKYWYAGKTSTDEFARFDFGTEIDLAAIEVAVPNRDHTVFFYGIAPNGAETLVWEWKVQYDANKGEVQRKMEEFRSISLKSLRIQSNEDDKALTISEIHPYGTVKGAGKIPVRTRIVID